MYLSGINLIPLNISHLELVRDWRNNSLIASFMEYQEYITKEAQQEWFKTIQNIENYYFIIETNNEKIGLIHLNKVDEINKSAHSGLFIGEEKYRGTGIALAASILILSFAFETLDLTKVYAKVNKDNMAVIEYNLFLGFDFETKMNDKFDLYKMFSQKFNEKKAYLTNLLGAIN
jgi:RimJ/RimL family protein N-acetyltransferase